MKVYEKLRPQYENSLGVERIIIVGRFLEAWRGVGGRDATDFQEPRSSAG